MKESEGNQVQSVRTTDETSRRRRSRQQGRRPSGSCERAWIEHEIWIFLQEWEVVEYEMGHEVKIQKKVKALCGRLYKRGLRKTWNSCLQLMLSMRDLHRTLCNEHPGTEALFSPYAWDLYRILGHRPQENQVPGALYDWSGNPLLSVYSQPPISMPPPIPQPWDSGIPASSGDLHGNSSSMLSSQDPLALRQEALEVSCSVTVLAECIPTTNYVAKNDAELLGSRYFLRVNGIRATLQTPMSCDIEWKSIVSKRFLMPYV
eukprot:XP_017455427.1 PREDICTED: uncharacterized protein LOC100912477 isoform X1 [Rattus norvegicus]